MKYCFFDSRIDDLRKFSTVQLYVKKRLTSILMYLNTQHRLSNSSSSFTSSLLLQRAPSGLRSVIEVSSRSELTTTSSSFHLRYVMPCMSYSTEAQPWHVVHLQRAVFLHITATHAMHHKSMPCITRACHA